jgi:FMN phosphatase YigB (HAD superfamily)
VLVPSTRNLIFDLGGVILDLSIDHTLHSFAKISKIDIETVRRRFATAPGFEEYEKGALDDSGFRNFVRETYSVTANDPVIDDCWNAMLRGIPQIKLDLLMRLQGEFRVFLLSNTNAIHIHHINEVMLPKMPGAKALETYFHKAYYSHRMRKRKPNADIFEEVMEENNLLPEQTVFLDDNDLNIEGARSLGIKTVHVTSPSLILDYFHAKGNETDSFSGGVIHHDICYHNHCRISVVLQQVCFFN